MPATKEFPCDLCGAREALEIPHARAYTAGQPIHICASCGLVYVKHRRSAQDIADDWSESLFGSAYTAAIPAVKARLTYVAEFLHGEVGVRGKRVLDIGAGEGAFLDLLRRPEYGAEVFGVEPSKRNGERMAQLGIPHLVGTIEDYARQAPRDRFDAVTIMWTLENCQDARGMLRAARSVLKPQGHLLVATGSRILVPFKKPLHAYLGPNPADTHALRFSANTLRGMLAVSGFEVAKTNRHLDSDILCMLARPAPEGQAIPWARDDPRAVAAFFDRWHAETAAHYPAPAR